MLLLLLLLLALSPLTWAITAPYRRSTSTAIAPPTTLEDYRWSFVNYFLIHLIIFKAQFRLTSRWSFLYLNKVIILIYCCMKRYVLFNWMQKICTLPQVAVVCPKFGTKKENCIFLPCFLYMHVCMRECINQYRSSIFSQKCLHFKQIQGQRCIQILFSKEISIYFSHITITVTPVDCIATYKK